MENHNWQNHLTLSQRAELRKLDVKQQRQRRSAIASMVSSGTSKPSKRKPKPTDPHKASALAELRRFKAGFKEQHGRPAKDVDVAAYVLARASGTSEAASLAPSHDSYLLAKKMGLTKYDPNVIVHTECKMTLGATVVDRGMGAAAEPRSQPERPAPTDGDWNKLPKAGHLPAAEKAELDRKMGLTSSGAGSANIKHEETRMSFGVVTP